MRKPLRQLLDEQVIFPPQFAAVVAKVEAFGVDYERAYAESEGRALHLVLLALGVPLPEILKSSTAPRTSPDFASLRRRLPLGSLPLMAAPGPRRPLVELVEDMVRSVAPTGLSDEQREPLAALGTDYERAYWDDRFIYLILSIFRADPLEFMAWLKEQRTPPPDDDETLRARWPLAKVLALLPDA